MNGSVGQALRDARIAKNLTVEEAARATKIRSERIADLEADDYMHFPNIVYARNFLILYSKYLGVDISRYPTLEIGFDTGVGEYSYLQHNEEETQPARRKRRHVAAAPPQKPRWLIAFFILLVALAAGALLGWSIMTIKRLGPVETVPPSATPTVTPTATPVPPPASSPTPAAMPGGEGTPVSKQPVEQVLRAVPVAAASPTPMASPTPSPVAEAEASPAVVVAVPVAPVTPIAPVAEATPSPSPAVAEPTPVVEGDEQEIAIRSSPKVRLRVIRDDPKSPSVYHGSLNPLMKPLIFVGKHFWIKTAEPDAVEVTIGGKPAPASAVEVIPTPGI